MKKHINKISLIILCMSLFLLFGFSNNKSSDISHIKHNREEIRVGLKMINSYSRDFIKVEDSQGNIIKAELTDSEYMFLKGNATASNFLYNGKLYSINNSFNYTENLNKNTIIFNKKIKNTDNIIQTINIVYKNTFSLSESITIVNNNKIPKLKNINKDLSYEIIYDVYEYKGELR